MSHFNEILRVIIAIMAAAWGGPKVVGLLRETFPTLTENPTVGKVVTWGVPVATGVTSYFVAKAVFGSGSGGGK